MRTLRKRELQPGYRAICSDLDHTLLMPDKSISPKTEKCLHMLMEQGVSPIDIANRVGHEAIQITYHYAHSYDTKGKEIANLLEKLEDKENES